MSVFRRGNGVAGRARSLMVGVLGAATMTVSALALPAAAAEDPGPGAFIIGGHDATEDYSFMASLQMGGEHMCGASLIKPDWVVTAAHCAGVPPGDVKVRIGSKDRTNGGTVASVKQVIVHPGFENGIKGSDVALMKLDKPVKEKPISIADSAGGPGTQTRILGWGVDCFDQKCEELPVTLQELDTKLVDAKNCADFAAGKELCTDSDTPDAQGCFGDSGGPQLKGKPGEWELIGATSRDGDKDPMCATGTGIWTDVTAHQDWIQQQIGK